MAKITVDLAPTPIRIEYKGVAFRSKLEADWALAFDNKGLHYQYEPYTYGKMHQSYDKKCKPYLQEGYTPDFLITHYRQPLVTIETKPLNGDIPNSIHLVPGALLVIQGYPTEKNLQATLRMGLIWYDYGTDWFKAIRDVSQFVTKYPKGKASWNTQKIIIPTWTAFEKGL